MPSDFYNLKDTGKACIGCGRTEQIMIKLPTYSLAFGCLECVRRHKSCGNLRADGQGKCNHEPHPGKVCQHCGCIEYMHSLVMEHDRQYSNCVGKAPTWKQCSGFGEKKCNNAVLLGPDGTLTRLCSECDREWMQLNIERVKEVQALISLDTTKETPQ